MGSKNSLFIIIFVTSKFFCGLSAMNHEGLHLYVPVYH